MVWNLRKLADKEGTVSIQPARHPATHHSKALTRVVCTLVLICIVVVPGIASAAIIGSEETMIHLNAAMSTLETAMAEGKNGNAAEASRLVGEAIANTREAISAMPSDPHGRQAIDMLHEAMAFLHQAVKVGNEGLAKKAADHVMVALDFTEAAMEHVHHAH